MSVLKIWESVLGSNGLPVIRLDERVNYQTVTFTGTAGVSVAFDSDTKVITLSADAACAVRVATITPTAVVTDFPLALNTPRDFEVAPGQRISVIAT